MSQLASIGKATNRREGRSIQFTVRQLSSLDFGQLHRLHVAILAELPDGVLAQRGEEYWGALVPHKGALFGAFDEERLIAYGAMEFASDFGVFRAKHVDVIREQELTNVAYFAGSCVHPDFRGSELQRRLSRERIDHALKSGYFHSLAAVSTLNPFSLGSLLAVGMTVKAMVPDEFGYDWFLHRDMRLTSEPVLSGDVLTVDAADTDRQKRLLSLGYWGVHLRGSKMTPAIEYAKRE